MFFVINIYLHARFDLHVTITAKSHIFAAYFIPHLSFSSVLLTADLLTIIICVDHRQGNSIPVFLCPIATTTLTLYVLYVSEKRQAFHQSPPPPPPLFISLHIGERRHYTELSRLFLFFYLLPAQHHRLFLIQTVLLVVGVLFRLFAAEVGVLTWGLLRGHGHFLQRALRLKPLLEPSLLWLAEAGYNLRYTLICPT